MKNKKFFGIIICIVILILFNGIALMATNLTLPAAGNVVVEFIGTDAAFINDVTVFSPVNQFLFNTSTTRIGQTSILGKFASGTVFEFRLLANTGSGTFLWSTDPAQNSDGQDHVRTTAIDANTFRIDWEDLPNLGDADFNDAQMVVHLNGDADGDGIWDSWEINGVDSNYDGVIDFPINLPPWNANPNHKDLFVEIDYMQDATHSHRPKQAAVNEVVTAFANAPVTNPDGVNGVTLHVDVSNALAEQTHLDFDPASGSGIGDFDTVKTANFDDHRRSVFHYCIFAHDLGQPLLFSGHAEIGGNDLIVSLGGWNIGRGDIDGDGLSDENVGTLRQQSGTFMHELGHNLGLHHGGDDDVNYKPDYISIMNYFFQFSGILPGGQIDYSNVVPLVLHENAGLDENVGIQDNAHDTNFYDPSGTIRYGIGSGPIDWNWNGNVHETNVTADVNDDAALTDLHGFNDWQNILYAFTSAGDFEDGIHLELIDEVMTPELAQTISDGSKKAGTEFTVGRFEIPTDWSSLQGGIAFSTTNPSEGKTALLITVPGWKEVISRNVDTTELIKISNQISFDLFIPANPVNRFWVGTCTPVISVLSSNKTFNLGEISLQGLPFGQYSTLVASLPSALVNFLKEPHPDVQFKLIVNTNTNLMIDNMRFTGNAFINPVRSFTSNNTGPGSTPALAVDLGAPGAQTRITPQGAFWVKITQLPNWPASKLFFGVASEDSTPLTGTVTILGQTIQLGSYYTQMGLPFNFASPVIFVVNNLGGRTYRLSWWAGN